MKLHLCHFAEFIDFAVFRFSHFCSAFMHSVLRSTSLQDFYSIAKPDKRCSVFHFARASDAMKNKQSYTKGWRQVSWWWSLASDMTWWNATRKRDWGDVESQAFLGRSILFLGHSLVHMACMAFVKAKNGAHLLNRLTSNWWITLCNGLKRIGSDP